MADFNDVEMTPVEHVHKEKKPKKHKKRHKHEEEDEAEGGQSASSLKIRIKVGAEKKKKKKEKKKKDKERRRRHKRHKEKKKHQLQLEDVEQAKEEEEDASSSTSSLTRFLNHALPMLEKRDPNRFFASPVTDALAPGYSQIIKRPMDFSSIKTKLNTVNGYDTLNAFKEDTIYYQTAKKLLAVGLRLLSPSKLMLMKKEMPFMEKLTVEQLGFDINAEPNDDEDDDEDEEEDDDDDETNEDVSKVIEDIREVVRRPPGRFEAIPDDMTAQEILENARNAAKAAKDKLTMRKPNSQMGFLRQKSDGSTSLSFLTGSDGVVPGTEKDRPVSLGELIGKVKQGTGAIQGFREDRRNVAKSVAPLYYGAFSSHGPAYDSTFANLTKEETDLVYSTYGDEVGVQYAESILNFSRNCDYAMFIVDHLLDILTDNAHRRTSKYIEEKKALRREDELLETVMPAAAENEDENQPQTEATEEPSTKKEPTAEIDFDAIKSLGDEGFDVSFLDGLKSEFEKRNSGTIDEQLEANASLLENLKETQTKRLSQPPPAHFAHLPAPGESELALANKVRENLRRMTSVLPPEQVISQDSIHKMLGIPIKSESE